MIDKTAASRIRLSTCSIVFLNQKHEDWLAGGRQITREDRSNFRVKASGFLVRPDLILTNRHVIEAIQADVRKPSDLQHWYAQFTYPSGEPGRVGEHSARVHFAFAFIRGETSIPDVGFVQIKRTAGGPFDICQPVEFGDLSEVAVGADIGVCGFPLGEDILFKSLDLWRFGPVIHQGIISGVAPYDADNPRHLTAFLTDANSAPGLSGGPVFNPSTGRVIGIHFGGTPGVVSVAAPIDSLRVDGWLAEVRAVAAGQTPANKMTSAGDLV